MIKKESNYNHNCKTRGRAELNVLSKRFTCFVAAFELFIDKVWIIQYTRLKICWTELDMAWATIHPSSFHDLFKSVYHIYKSRWCFPTSSSSNPGWVSTTAAPVLLLLVLFLGHCHFYFTLKENVQFIYLNGNSISCRNFKCAKSLSKWKGRSTLLSPILWNFFSIMHFTGSSSLNVMKQKPLLLFVLVSMGSSIDSTCSGWQ